MTSARGCRPWETCSSTRSWTAPRDRRRIPSSTRSRSIPPTGRPFQAQIVVSPYVDHWDDFFYAGAGDVRAVRYDPATHAATFDLTDKSNSSSAQMAAADAMESALLANKPAPLGEAITGPPWVVPATCPTCGAPVDQATMAMQPTPKCAHCEPPLPVQPRARF